ncbi:hypothetical protein B0H19DRAFT_1241380 [Mycena capillaripes]|nr:hypothetical protein B0H19DRAFT_1241380 [Mycena capillaripes]
MPTLNCTALKDSSNALAQGCHLIAWLVSRCAISDELHYLQDTLTASQCPRPCYKTNLSGCRYSYTCGVQRYSTSPPADLIKIVEVSSGSTPLKHASTYSFSSGHLCIATVHDLRMSVIRNGHVIDFENAFIADTGIDFLSPSDRMSLKWRLCCQVRISPL